MHHHNTRHFTLNIDAQLSEPDVTFWARQVRVREAQLANRMNRADLGVYLEALGLAGFERYEALTQKVRELDCNHPEGMIVTDHVHRDWRDPSDYEERTTCKLCGKVFAAEELAERYQPQTLDEIEF